MKIEKRYLFQAHAVAASAHIRRPTERILWIPAATALPVTGGYGKSEAGRTELHDLISLDAATAEVSGDYVDKEQADAQERGLLQEPIAVRVEAAATVTNLSYLKRLQVNKISAQLIAADSQEDDEQPRFTFQAKAPDEKPITGLSIDGFPVRVELDERYNELNTYRAIAHEYEHNEEFREEYRERFAHNGEEHSLFHPHRIPSYRGRILTSIVRPLRWAEEENPNARLEGNRIEVNDFGTIYVGELIISEHHRRVTLLRIVLGLDDNRCSSFGDVGTPGTPWT